MNVALGRLWRAVATNNPLYAISAALFLAGLRSLYVEDADPGKPWLLVVMLTGYTGAVTGVGIWAIRRLRVWDDARSILLVVVVLLLSGSMLFDESVVRYPQTGALLLAGSLAFSIAVSESIVVAARLSLPMGFRAVWWLVLSAFHVWPAVTSMMLFARGAAAADLMCAAFPAVVAIALAPAVLRISAWSTTSMPGRSGWTFPAYPLTTLLLAGVAAGLRAPLLALSFGGGPASDSIFGLWMTLPLAATFGVALVELAATTRSRSWAQAAIYWPAIVVAFVVASPAPSAAARLFELQFSATFGVTSSWALAVAAVLWLASACRRRPGAEGATAIGCLVLLVALWSDHIGGVSGPAGALPAGALAVAFAAVAAIRTRLSAPAFATIVFTSTVGALGAGRRLDPQVSLALAVHVWIVASALLSMALADRYRTALAWSTGGLMFAVGWCANIPPTWTGSTPDGWQSAAWTLTLAVLGELLGRATGTLGPRLSAAANLFLVGARLIPMLFRTFALLPLGVRLMITAVAALIPACLASYAKRRTT